MRRRVALAVALAGLAGGCLHADERAPRIREMIVPPIVRVDRAVPASTFGSAIGRPAGTGCSEVTRGGEVRPCSPKAERELERATRDGLPRRGAVARVVAELPLRRPRGFSRRAEFVVFSSRRLGVCFGVVTDPERDRLACQATTRCPGICLGWYTEGKLLLLAGTVPASGDGLRLLYAGGAEQLYSLSGPLVPRVEGRRAFMVDLGRGPTPDRLQLVAGDRVLESVGWDEMQTPRR